MGPDEHEFSEMMKTVKISFLEELMSQVFPSDVADPKAFQQNDIQFPDPLTEFQYFNHFSRAKPIKKKLYWMWVLRYPIK